MPHIKPNLLNNAGLPAILLKISIFSVPAKAFIQKMSEEPGQACEWRFQNGGQKYPAKKIH